jgi:hypothetical protein
VTPPVVERLLAGIAARDHEAIASCFDPGARLRVLTPRQVREEDGVDAIAARYRHWLDPLEEFEVVASSATPVADRVRVLYHFRGRDPEHGPQENEHAGYARVEDGRVAALDLTCTGFRPAG